jgi:hypothetical protein
MPKTTARPADIVEVRYASPIATRTPTHEIKTEAANLLLRLVGIPDVIWLKMTVRNINGLRKLDTEIPERS